MSFPRLETLTPELVYLVIAQVVEFSAQGSEAHARHFLISFSKKSEKNSEFFLNIKIKINQPKK
jgi:hypothetical protein